MTVTLIRALLIYFTVILAMRIMGKRQIGELNPHELVITILVSQIASIPLQDNAMPLANAFLPMLLLVSLEILASVASMKSLRLRNLLQGRPILLIRHGKPDQKQMRRLRFTVDDLIGALRQKDVFDLSTVEEAVVETNGSLSVRLRTEESPVTPKQLGIPAPDNGSPIPVVTDGHIVPEYFGDQVLDTAAIAKALQKESLRPGEQLVVTIDDSGTVFAVKKERKK